MNQKSKTKRFIALFVAIVMMASMFSAVTAFAGTFELGEFCELESDGWGWWQRWNMGVIYGDDDEVETEHPIPMDTFRAATHLVLEFFEEPENNIFLIIFGEGNGWSWRQEEVACFDNDDEVFEVTIDLRAHSEYSAVAGGSQGAIVLGSAGLWQVIRSAHLVLEGGATVTPVTPVTPVVPVTPAGASVLELALDNVNYTLNGTRGTLEVAPQSIGGRTMVPLRFIAETLGAQVDWNPDTETATFTLGTKSASVKIGQELPDNMGTAVIEGGRTLVPVRFVSAEMGADVQWIDATRTVIITFGTEATSAVELPLPIDEDECDDDCDHDHDDCDDDDCEDEEEATEAPAARPAPAEGAPTGNVLRAEQKNAQGHGAVQFDVSVTAGNDYTLSFWAYNAPGRDDIMVQWSHYPQNIASINEDGGGLEAFAGQWTYVEVPFTVPAANNSVMQIVPGSGSSGDVFYLYGVTITGANGNATSIPLSALRRHWDDDAFAVSIVPAP
jgi:hypothetical protein